LARGKARKRKSIWRGLGYLALAAVTLLVAGFIVRHDLGPALWSYIIHRGSPTHQTQRLSATPARPSLPAVPVTAGSPVAGGRDASSADAAGGPRSVSAGTGEHLTAPERQALDEIIRKHTR
jgi:hypothetical protein